MAAAVNRTDTDPSIAWDETGRGEPALLCLPGWCSDRGIYTDFARLAAPHRRTLTLDWRGHGDSAPVGGEFGQDELVEDALAVIAASGATHIVPVANAHAGWVAIELRRRLGARVPALVLLDWLVLEAPLPFLGALAGLQDPQQWAATREQLFAMWLADVVHPGVIDAVRGRMGRHDAAMWARAARAVAAAYRAAGAPLYALSQLDEPVPVLHLCAQGGPGEALRAQQVFAADQPWFTVHRLAARTHFPMLETPETVAGEIEAFLQRQGF